MINLEMGISYRFPSRQDMTLAVESDVLIKLIPYFWSGCMMKG